MQTSKTPQKDVHAFTHAHTAARKDGTKGKEKEDKKKRGGAGGRKKKKKINKSERVKGLASLSHFFTISSHYCHGEKTCAVHTHTLSLSLSLSLSSTAMPHYSILRGSTKELLIPSYPPTPLFLLFPFLFLLIFILFFFIFVGILILSYSCTNFAMTFKCLFCLLRRIRGRNFP